MHTRTLGHVTALLFAVIATADAQDRPRLDLSEEEAAVVSTLSMLDVGVTEGQGVLSVHIRETLNEPVVTCLERISRLGTLFMTHRRLTDEDLTVLQGVPIKGLVVGSADISDQSARLLGDMPALTSFSVWNGGVTDEDLRRLSRLDRLKKLTVQKSGVTDVGLQHVSKMRNAWPQRDKSQRCRAATAQLIERDRELGAERHCCH